MSSTEPGVPSARPRRTSRINPLQKLDELASVLTDILRAVDEDPRRMDANHKDAHKNVEDIRGLFKAHVFTVRGPLSPVAYREIHDSFETARAEENDQYEVYADDIERYLKRRRKDLGVAQSDDDKKALVFRRRSYMVALTKFHDEVIGILAHIRDQSSSA